MAATTTTAKLAKLNNRKSKRDIEREIRIAQKGGQPIEVFYGQPLHDEDRARRIQLEMELRYPIYDAEIKKKVPVKKINNRSTGSSRTAKQFITSVLKTAKTRSEALGIPFDLEVDDLVIPELCPVFGTPLIWTDKITNDTPSLDRYIPSKGYVKGNVVFMSFKANRLKSNASLQDLEKIVEWMRLNENNVG